MDYNEILCQAMSIIGESLLDGIAYDTTLTCTITDDSDSKNGKYTVSNGSVEFIAYSTVTTYKNNTVVYVSIPNGDYNNQKFIVGKKSSDKTEPFIFTTPFDTIVDLTNNIITEQEPAGLIANGEEQSVVIWQNTTPLNYAGYERFGIQGQFKTWLDNANVVLGNYGLKVTMRYKVGDSTNGWQVGEKTLLLDSSDMYGNPYSFESFYQQEKVFDIGDLGTITDIKVEFYQIKNSFITDKQTLLTIDEFANLFIKDVYLCIGYDLGTITDEFIKLYTFDTNTYIATQTIEENRKIVHTRWVHFDENNKPIVVDSSSDMNYEIRWYRYHLGAPSADEYCGVYWDRVNDNSTKRFSYTLDPDITKATEQVKVIILYNGVALRSEILSFRNEKEVINQPTVDAIQALTIVCDDNTYGNYLIYDKGNSLIDKTQGNEIRQFSCHFDSADYPHPEGETILTEATSITWTIPAINSMIVIDGFNYDTLTSSSWDTTYDATTQSIIIKRLASADGQINAYQPYRIKTYYSTNYANNTIQCSILKDGINYNTQKECTFGQAGTTGTDCTLVIDFDKNNTAVTLGNTSELIAVTARLYDYENNEIDLTKETKIAINWAWYKNTGSAITIQNYIENGKSIINKKELKVTSGLNMNDLYILEVTLTGWGDYKSLIAYLPIPIRVDKTYSYIAGATQIIYLSNGEAQYYKKPYTIFGTGPTNGTWQIYCKDAQAKHFIPDLSEDYRILPVDIFVENSPIFGVQYLVGGVVKWTQPILSIMNRYPSGMINEWDGKTLTIDGETGAIISTMIAAGSKDNNNQFSGVMMGDWSSDGDASISKMTGIYGFNKGEMSFAFTEDGKAFIGKSGRGRIRFDGDKGTIESDSWAAKKQGMHIDLDDGIINFVNGTNFIDIDGTASTYPFQIGNYNSPNLRVNWDGKLIAVTGDFSDIDVRDMRVNNLDAWDANIDGLVAKNVSINSMYASDVLIENLNVSNDAYISSISTDNISSSGGSITNLNVTNLNGIKLTAQNFVLSNNRLTFTYLRQVYNPATKTWSGSQITTSDPSSIPANTPTLRYIFQSIQTGDTFTISMGEGSDGVTVTSIILQEAPKHSIVLRTGINIGLYAGNSVLIRGNLTHLGEGGEGKVDFSRVPASKQIGIYARFA